jgi:hypothetical protein
MGQVLKKTTMPRVEAIAEATASCRQTSPDSMMPQNARAAPMKPRREMAQKALATAVAVVVGSEGISHDRAASQPPVLSPGLDLIQI